jgi:branched-chain amino acid transport system ATP-binding protein
VTSLLQTERFEAAYGPVPVVRGVSLAVAAGDVVALLGRNGMGKTTLMRGLIGLAPVRHGTVRFAGADIINAPPEAIAHAGISYVPAGREIFGTLSVRENLLMCARPSSDGASAWTFDKVLALFPRLAERLNNGGQQLSGGEQQMLAIGRALMTNPRLLLIDEATEGLAPLIARDIWTRLREICASGVGAIIVDRDVKRLAQIAGRAIVLFRGEVAFDGAPATLLADSAMMAKYIGL